MRPTKLAVTQEEQLLIKRGYKLVGRLTTNKDARCAVAKLKGRSRIVYPRMGVYLIYTKEQQ